MGYTVLLSTKPVGPVFFFGRGQVTLKRKMTTVIDKDIMLLSEKKARNIISKSFNCQCFVKCI